MKPVEDSRGSRGADPKNTNTGNNIVNSKNNTAAAEGVRSSNGNKDNSGKKEVKKEFRSSNRRWRGNRNRNRNRDKDKERDNEQNRDKTVYKCELCGKDIKEISSAIALQNSQGPVHFDCVIDKLKKENTLEANDKIVYLGAGNFGIVRVEKNKPAKDFKIVKKLEVENRDDKPEWRNLQLKVK